MILNRISPRFSRTNIRGELFDLEVLINRKENSQCNCHWLLFFWLIFRNAETLFCQFSLCAAVCKFRSVKTTAISNSNNDLLTISGLFRDDQLVYFSISQTGNNNENEKTHVDCNLDRYTHNHTAVNPIFLRGSDAYWCSHRRSKG